MLEPIQMNTAGGRTIEFSLHENYFDLFALLRREHLDSADWFYFLYMKLKSITEYGCLHHDHSFRECRQSWAERK